MLVLVDMAAAVVQLTLLSCRRSPRVRWPLSNRAVHMLLGMDAGITAVQPVLLAACHLAADDALPNALVLVVEAAD